MLLIICSRRVDIVVQLDIVDEEAVDVDGHLEAAGPVESEVVEEDVPDRADWITKVSVPTKLQVWLVIDLERPDIVEIAEDAVVDGTIELRPVGKGLRAGK